MRGTPNLRCGGCGADYYSASPQIMGGGRCDHCGGLVAATESAPEPVKLRRSGTPGGLRLALVLVAIAGVLVWESGVQAAAPVDPVATVESTTCQEDARCWNWPRMGNRQRGVVTVDGRRRVVGVCQFQRLAQAGRLSYWPLRGDRLAMRRGGCRR